MSGETGEVHSGWSIDTLHEHMIGQIQGIHRQIDGRVGDLHREIETRQDTLRRESMARADTLHDQISALQEMLLERYQTQEKGLQTALTAAEKAVGTALVSAEKAVVKAEIASDKRFESVNEFRQQLADQAATFPSRIEVDARLISLTEKIEALTNSNANRITELTSRVDKATGIGTGQTAEKDIGRQNLTVIIAAVGLLIAAIAAVYALKP